MRFKWAILRKGLGNLFRIIFYSNFKGNKKGKYSTL